MVDLTDGRVTGEQLALASAKLADIAKEQQGAGALTRFGQRDRAHGDTRPARLHLGPPWHPPGHNQRKPFVHGLIVAQHLAGNPHQRVAGHVTDMSQAMDGRDGIGARIAHRPLGVETHHTVTDAGGAPPLTSRSAQGGELSLRDHPRKIVRAGPVGQLQAAGSAQGSQVGMPGEYRQRASFAHDRDGLLTNRHVVTPLGVPVPHDPQLPESLVQQGPTSLIRRRQTTRPPSPEPTGQGRQTTDPTAAASRRGAGATTRYRRRADRSAGGARRSGWTQRRA
jgi:hypothetical protein